MPLNLVYKRLLYINKKKDFYIPKLNSTKRNISSKSKNSNNNSIKSEISSNNTFIKKVPNKYIVLNFNNSINNNRLELIKKIKNNINKNKITKTNSYKNSIKNYFSTKKITKKINNSKKNIPKKINNYNIYKDSRYALNKTKTKNNFNNNNNDDRNKEKEKNKIYDKEKKIFGMMLKKKSLNDNKNMNNFNYSSTYYYLNDKSLGNIINTRNSYKIENNSSSILKINKTGSFSNKLFLKKSSKYNNSNLLKNEKIIDNYNYDNKKNMNTISYNSNYSTSHLRNIPYLNHIKINNKNNLNEKNKKPLKLNLIPKLPFKKININNKYTQIINNTNSNYISNFNTNYISNNNTINITIDNTVNNIYDIINVNKNTKLTFIKKINNINNNRNKFSQNKKMKEKQSLVFTKKLFKNDSINHNHSYQSYQNLIINCQNKKFKSKEKKKIGGIKTNKYLKSKENLKKIHEKNKKKQLFISLNNIHLNKAKLLGIKEIFSNFSKIKAKSPKFETPKINTCFYNFNKIIFSGRFNFTEDKNVDFFTSMSEKYKNKNLKMKEDPQYVYEYFYEILNNLLIEENIYFENLDFSQFNLIINKNYLNPDSRKFFINSLINIQELLNFTEKTLFLSVQIFDRYINNVLMKNHISLKEEDLDIVIVTSLIIAAKKQEIKLYSMSDYLNLLPLKYKVYDLEKTEYAILSGLDFNLDIPCLLDFYEIFSIENKLNKFQKAKGLFLLNSILLDYNLVQIPSSLIAYTVVYLISGKIIQFNKIKDEYLYKDEIRFIKILSILKDKKMINNFCGYIKYWFKINKNSSYNAPIIKFNTSNYYYISSYLDI